MKKEKEKVVSYWERKQYGANWFSFFAEYIMRSITGKKNYSPLVWALETHVPSLPLNNILEIGCLRGKKLFYLLSSGFAVNGHGTDIAEAAVRDAEKSSIEKNLQERASFSVLDLNHPALPPATFDAVISNGVLHHIRNLEACVKNIYDSLNPGGYLFASEYIGPNRFRYTEKEIQAINEAIKMLPDDLANGPYNPARWQKTLELDPSEAVRPEDITDTLFSVFDDVTIKPYGGTILRNATSKKLFKNFEENNPIHKNAVINLIEYEKKLLSHGLHSHYAYFAALKK